MPSENSQMLQYYAQKLSEALSPFYFLQIGAMDGVQYDPIHHLVKRYQWHGVLVEPLPENVKELKHNYRDIANLQFANVAIDASAGIKTFYRILPEDIARSGLPEWCIGISSFSREHLVMHDQMHQGISHHIVETQVDALTLPELLQTYPLPRIDLLQIDVEGYDWVVLSQLDFSIYKPRIINLEFARLSQEHKSQLLQRLFENHYMVTACELDLLAIHCSIL
jgi:FkbM family methyltransferase